MTRVGIVVHVSVAGIFIGYLKCIFNRYQNLNCVTLYAIFISGHRPKTWELLLLLLLFFILLLVFLIYALSTLTTVLPLFFPYLTPPNPSYLSLSTYPYSCPCISQNIRCRPRSRYWPCYCST